jgi:dethiobiotin synthetase
LYAAADGAADLALVNPVWLRVPAAPYSACLVENRLLDVDAARNALRTLRSAHEWVIVEGVGGWRVPLTADLCASDFAAEIGAPVLVVAANKLGALNHTQLTVDAVRMRALRCLGVLLNRPEPGDATPASVTNEAVLEQLLPVPLLGEVPHGASALSDALIERIHTALLA